MRVIQSAEEEIYGKKKLLKTAYLIKESQWSDIKESKGA